jgi:serine/threonine protein kinase
MNHVLGENCFNDNPDHNRPLPEIFLWHVFIHVTNACFKMREKVKLGQKYVHIDIKPVNIFVNEGISDQWPAYKTPALGDFGLYRILGSDHLDGQAGTRGFLAPEQFGPYPSIPLRTDVWQIGMVMWSLMRERPDGVDFTDKEGDWEMADYLLDEEGDYDAL